ncbi:DnaJ domain-containing protein [Achromobacter xylosoxidans]
MGTKLHTHYDNLKVARNAPDFVIRAAYKALSQQYHPDKHGGDPAAANAMRLINEAYAELSDPARRAAHDAWIAKREMQARQQAQRAQAQPQHQAPPNSPRPATKPARPQPTPQPPTASHEKSDFWIYGIGLLILFFIFVMANKGGSSGKATSPSLATAPPAPMPGISNQRAAPPAATTTPAPDLRAPAVPVWEDMPRGRVSAQELNVRAGAGPNFDVIARLRFLDTVTIEGPATNGWLPVSHSAGFGFVNSAYIQLGPDADTLQRVCADGSPLPTTGTTFKRPTTAGEHELRITSPAGQDAIVKLKDAQGRTVISGYVRRGDTHTFRGIPGGSYNAWFATGEEFSSRCGRFLRNMNVTYDPSPQLFKVTYSGNLSYSTVITYSLQMQRQGNFSPTAADTTSFLVD